MQLNVTSKDLTLTALFTATVLLVAEIEKVLAFISSSLANSPYVAIFEELKPEVCILAGVILFSRSEFLAKFVADYPKLRGSWKGPIIRLPWVTWRLYLEELVFIALAVIVFVSSTFYVADSVRRSYSRYGLIYIARANCLGDFKSALERTEAIRDNPLWSRYQAELIRSVPRLRYLVTQRPVAVASLFRATNTLGSTEKLSVLAGGKAVFGTIAVERYLDRLEDGTSEVAQRWRRYLSEETCQ
ncbi:hypothetical protein [Rhizobium terrae]|uniref:hypothetical protein n=1 Tax=Rhizobium terrae TaxID=2171756 RepID=UPI000E3CDD03|nr:hypothetical protein [Rhizobium terrae]